MTKEDLPIDENEQSTLDNESESESAELDSLFDSEETNEETPVSREEFNNLIKGVQKLATIKGREKKQVEEVKEVVEAPKEEKPMDDVSELFFSSTPQAELVQDDLQAIADAKYDGSILKAWRNEKWVQEKASVLDSAKKEDEVNKSKVSKPSASTGASKMDFSHVKSDEDLSKLSEADKVKYVKLQREKEQM